MAKWKKSLLTLTLLLGTSASASLSEFEGFFPIEDLFTAPVSVDLRESIFKIYLQEDTTSPFAMHGTAFGLANGGILLTNVHNMTQCLRKHDLLDTGYDGKGGPLDCHGFVVVDDKGQPYGDIQLVASNSRTDLHDHYQDFAVIKVVGLANGVLPLHAVEMDDKSEPLFVVGYPGATRRNVEFLTSAKNKIITALELVYDFTERIEETSEGNTEELFLVYMELFKNLQVALPPKSEFLSGTTGFFQFGLHNYSDYNFEAYQERLLFWANSTLKDFYIFYKVVDRGLSQRESDEPGFLYPDANNGLKASRAMVAGNIDTNGHLGLRLRGDGRPGSSGSPLIDAKGAVHGIVHAVDIGEISGATSCQMDAAFSDFESPEYSYCEDVGLRAVPASSLIEKLVEWEIEFVPVERP